MNVYSTAGLQLTRNDGRVVSLTVCGARGRPGMDELKKIGALLEAAAH